MSLCGTNDDDDDEQLKIELLSQWKLEACTSTHFNVSVAKTPDNQSRFRVQTFLCILYTNSKLCSIKY